jgi:hypothetical protein
VPELRGFVSRTYICCVLIILYALLWGITTMRPLAPLTVDEVEAAAGACRATAQQKGIPNLRFNTITLQVQPVLLADLLAHWDSSGMPASALAQP